MNITDITPAQFDWFRIWFSWATGIPIKELNQKRQELMEVLEMDGLFGQNMIAFPSGLTDYLDDFESYADTQQKGMIVFRNNGKVILFW